MAYTSFPIADPKTGLYEAKQPWLTPADAFSEVNDWYTFRGVYSKRKGYSEFAQMNHYETSISGITKADPGVVTVADVSNIANGATVLLYNVAGMTEVNGNTYTVANRNAGANTFELSGTDTSGFTTYTSGGKVALFETNAITGIHEHITSTGTRDLLVFDTLRVAKYNTTNEVLEDLVESDTFTGDAEDRFWLDNWKGSAYFCNNVDRLYSYNGTSVAAVDVDIDGDSSNELTTCLVVFPFKERLCLLRTTEDGTAYPQRLRYSKVDDPTTWDDTIANGGGYVDAPTGQWITGARFLKDVVVVFFQKSIWVIRYTGNDDLPFRWEKIHDFQNDAMEMRSTQSIINLGDQVWSYGSTGFVGSDGFVPMQVTEKIPDLTLKANQAKRHILSAGKLEPLRQVWVAYPHGTSTTNDRIFVYNYEENTWTLFRIPVNVFGYYRRQSTLTWDDVTDAWDDIEESWDEFGIQGGEAYPMFLGGSYAGKVWKLNDTGQDNGSSFSASIKTARWNPFTQQGRRSRFGWIEFLLSTNDTTAYTIKFYVDYDSSPWQTLTLNADGDSTADKVWKRLDAGIIGAAHRIEITSSDSTRPQIHAIIPYFEVGGTLVQ
jgi:hypothetical protein